MLMNSTQPLVLSDIYAASGTVLAIPDVSSMNQAGSRSVVLWLIDIDISFVSIHV